MGVKEQRQIFFNEQRLLERRFCIGKLNTKNSSSERRGISFYRFSRFSRFVGESGLKRKLYWSETDGEKMFTACDDVIGNFYCTKYFRG